MVAHEDLARLWGEGNVERVDVNALDRVTLPADAASVLVNVGLPRRVDPLFEAKEPTMIEAPSRAGRYCQFGSDFGTELCVSTDTGDVVSVSLTGEYPDRFVNTTLALFVEFLVMVSAERARFLDLGDDQIDQVIVGLEKRLHQLDARALADPDNWWAVIVEQMRDGLL